MVGTSGVLQFLSVLSVFYILYIFRFQRFHVISAKLMKNLEVIFCIFNCKDRREGKGNCRYGFGGQN